MRDISLPSGGHCAAAFYFASNVVYTERPSTIWIVAVAHRSRRPDYWTKRLKDIPL
ncbi:MAG: hypothetical protein WCT04_02950 [Planctomycetota bacterium]